jgi:hypothetical protein
MGMMLFLALITWLSFSPFNLRQSLSKNKVTSLGEISPFGLLLGYFLGENMFYYINFKSSGEVGYRCFELLN